MRYETDDLRIRSIKEVVAPKDLHTQVPITEAAARTVYETRRAIQRLLHGEDDRLLVVVGPCSVHDPEAALEYAGHLDALRTELREHLLIVMRVYFEKPRTTVGWKGLINDPNLDGSFEINKGLELARRLLVDLNERGVPAGTEFLDLISPQYIADLVSWGAIEPDYHREPRAPRARLGAVVPGGLQERHRRQHQGCDRRHPRRGPATRVHVADQGWAFGDLQHRGQRGHAHDPARRQPPELRHRERRHRGARDRGLRAGAEDHDRLQPCQ
jgi:hypothetical protein